MKKSFKFLFIIVFVLMTTGCVKMEIGMNINKDKSMNLTIIEAINKELLAQENGDILDKTQLDKIKKEGFKVENYTEDKMSGYKFTKSIDNIDAVSTKDEIKGDLSLLSEDKETTKYLFTVKKGLFKNTYSAKLKSSDLAKINEQTESITPNTEEDVTIEENNDSSISDFLYVEDQTTNTEDTEQSDIDISKYASMLSSGMQVNFTVNLPYKALSNNATAVKNDGKKLVWDLLNTKDENIEFEFQLYNMTIIYITVGLILVLLITIIVRIIKKKKENKNKPEEKISIIEQLNSVKTADIENMPSQPNVMKINPISKSVEKPVTKTQEPKKTIGQKDNIETLIIDDNTKTKDTSNTDNNKKENANKTDK